MKRVNLKKVLNFIIKSLTFITLSFLVKFSALFFINSANSIDNKVFSLIFVKNTGAAFSLFQDYTHILIWLSSIILLYIVIYIVKNSASISKIKITTLSLLTAGIAGNLYERISDGFVTDYIKLNFINFPVFNAFDILITIGAFLLIITLYNSK